MYFHHLRMRSKVICHAQDACPHNRCQWALADGLRQFVRSAFACATEECGNGDWASNIGAVRVCGVLHTAPK